MSMPVYKDRPTSASDGSAFADLCLKLSRELLHEDLCPTGNDVTAQIEIGDTYEGDEFKHLQKAFYYLHIEIAERRDLGCQWHESGIYCNRRRYWCGNGEDVFVFDVEVLRFWRQQNKPRLVWHGGAVQYVDPEQGIEHGTIESFVISKVEANKICLYRFSLADDGKTWYVSK